MPGTGADGRGRARRNQRFTAADFAHVRRYLERQCSPEQVAGYLRRVGALRISHETIYRHVWADRRGGGTLYQHLRGARKQRRKRYGRYDSRGRLAGKRHRRAAGGGRRAHRAGTLGSNPGHTHTNDGRSECQGARATAATTPPLQFLPLQRDCASNLTFC